MVQNTDYKKACTVINIKSLLEHDKNMSGHAALAWKLTNQVILDKIEN